MGDLNYGIMAARQWRARIDRERRRRLWAAAGEASLVAISAIVFIIVIYMACAVSGGGSMRTTEATRHERMDMAARRARMAWAEGLKR